MRSLLALRQIFFYATALGVFALLNYLVLHRSHQASEVPLDAGSTAERDKVAEQTLLGLTQAQLDARLSKQAAALAAASNRVQKAGDQAANEKRYETEKQDQVVGTAKRRNERLDWRSYSVSQGHRREAYLWRLVSRGEAGVRDIRDLLLQQQDLERSGLGFNEDLAQATSLRIALFDALREIGGAEAEAVLLDEIQRSVDPLEIATLAKHLNELAPEKYHKDAMRAARETLELAWKGELEGRNVTPLFQVFRDYGDRREVAAELHRNTWRDWGPPAIIAMAELERGAGIPLLTRMARSGLEDRPEVDVLSDRRLLALQALTEAAPANQKALNVLLEQANLDRVPDRLWPALASTLAGDRQLKLEKLDDPAYDYDTYQSGDHVIYVKHGKTALSGRQIAARIAVIDKLLAVTPSPAAFDALETAQKMLMSSGYGY